MTFLLTLFDKLHDGGGARGSRIADGVERGAIRVRLLAEGSETGRTARAVEWPEFRDLRSWKGEDRPPRQS